MSKIGTITFHWAANYGAVLQAYALQSYLISKGVDTQIIDYVPGRVSLTKMLAALKGHNFKYFKKKKLLRKFCEQELRLTKKTYRSNRALTGCKDLYDAVICGSDQIWNESFTLGAEGRPTLSYYLNFVGSRTKKVAYSVSFGTSALQERTVELIAPQVTEFFKISVRERTGQEILNKIGISAELTVDPTLLLTKEKYEKLFINRTLPRPKKVFTYILHEGQKTAQEVCHLVQRHFNQPQTDGNELYIELCQWLNDLAHAEFVVTNSFHGAVFSLLFHRPFVLLPVENSGMNDRIQTLMGAVGLSQRIVTSVQEAQQLLQQQIDWDAVDARLSDMRRSSENYLNEVIA